MLGAAGLVLFSIASWMHMVAIVVGHELHIEHVALHHIKILRNISLRLHGTCCGPDFLHNQPHTWVSSRSNKKGHYGADGQTAVMRTEADSAVRL